MKTVFILLADALGVSMLWAQSAFQPKIFKTWDDAELAAWATPIAGLNVRPTHMSEKDYYALRVENLGTYPVYAPSREPEGYWKMLQQIGPKPLIEPGKLKNEADGITPSPIVLRRRSGYFSRAFSACSLVLNSLDNGVNSRPTYSKSSHRSIILDIPDL